MENNEEQSIEDNLPMVNYTSPSFTQNTEE